MTSASIDLQKLQTLIDTLRRSKLPPKQRRQLIEDFLKVIDVIKIDHNENLVCIKHSMELRGYKNHSSIYRSGERHRLHNFRVCCRDFYLRSEIEQAPKSKGTTGKERKVRVGM